MAVSSIVSSALSSAVEDRTAAAADLYTTDLHTIDPLSDRRWDDLAASHPQASAFHERGWLKALALTYGYRPVVLTSTPPEQPLQDGIVFCQVCSWITGSRLVSLPFSDHCEPLLQKPGDFSRFAAWLGSERERERWKYVELRLLSEFDHSNRLFEPSDSYWFHTLDLTPPIEQIFKKLHKNSMQRRIQRAEREQLAYENGRSAKLADEFYHLLLMTRRRHRLLPQPRAWFRNLIRYLGSKISIRVARSQGIPIAAMLTLQHRNTVIYKYGCSDERFHNLAGMPFLYWKLIEESKAAGAEQIDLGRTDLDNEGLTQFKDRLGSVRRRLTYLRYPARAAKPVSQVSALRRVISWVPDPVLAGASRLVYRHVG